jgi:cyclopropane-fatty-acyl-phospholipid synthase
MLAAYAKNKLRTAVIEVNGTRPHDIKIYDNAVLSRALVGGFEKLGEDYQLRRWDADDLPGLLERLIKVDPPPVAKLVRSLRRLPEHFLNLQSQLRARKNVENHYDLGTRFYGSFLDPYMQYSCAYFENGAKTLEQAQLAKLELIRRKLRVEKGMRVLDIGCGWGGLAAYLAEHADVRVTGITLSIEQLSFAQQRYAPLIERGKLRFELMDYREAPEMLDPFDRIVSVGMVEHVGERNLDRFFECADALLKYQGVFLLHGITGQTGRVPAWIGKYVFPGGSLPRVPILQRKAVELFTIWDEHFFGKSYAETLQRWKANFLRAWPELRADLPKHPLSPVPYGSDSYAEWFRRTWILYLDSCTAAFRTGRTDLCQMVLGKGPRPYTYSIVR